ncbi:MAG: hypothetical protein KGJ88_07475 [Verrucomicrobiota bacterium]|nr:hypothetical protein [Verrucomicrobiota bacterium]
MEKFSRLVKNAKFVSGIFQPHRPGSESHALAAKIAGMAGHLKTNVNGFLKAVAEGVGFEQI